MCVSASAYEHIQGRVSANFSDIGEQSLKNILRRVRAYALSPAAVAEAKVEEPAPAGVSSSFAPASVRGEPPRLSLVVLPFANIGGDPAQDYFVEGVTDSLTTDLSRIRGAFVIARSTAFTFKGKPIDVRAIGRELSVRYALEGSVERRGDRLRVNVQLLDTQSGGNIWAERFDKPLSDFFDMQDEIVTRLVNQIGVELVRVEATRSERNQSPDALDLVFQGMAWSFKGLTFENVARARAFFERAITLDRDNVAALAWTSIADLAAARSFHSDDAVARLASAETAATKALSLAPDNPLARLSLAFVFALTKRAEQAIAQCGRALELNPNFAYAHALIGFCKALVGRADETEAHVQEALRLSPRDVEAHTWLTYVGAAKILLGRHEEAVAWLRRSIEANPNNSVAQFHLAAALAHVGRMEQARAAAAAGLALHPQCTIARHEAVPLSDNPVYLAGRKLLFEGLRKAGLPEGAPQLS